MWFDAQVSDHGSDVALPDMGEGHEITEEMWRLHHGGDSGQFPLPRP